MEEPIDEKIIADCEDSENSIKNVNLVSKKEESASYEEELEIANLSNCCKKTQNEAGIANINYPYVNSCGNKKAGLVYRLIKRVFDATSSFALLIVLSITLILPILTIIVAIKTKGNPFFVQKRPGKNGKFFKLIKFRTMTNEKDDQGNMLPDEVRLTKFGKTLRDTSLDELPELFNILFGQMSVVGPRPQLVRDMVFFSKDAMRRQSVKPGLTGYAQVNGRNNVTWEQKFDLDLAYLDKMSISLDISILFKTVSKIIKSSDVATEGMETAEDYGVYLLRNNSINKELFNAKLAEAKKLL